MAKLHKSNGSMSKKVFLSLAVCFIFFSGSAQDAKNRWVDSVMQTMSVQEKIGQLFMLSVSAYGTEEELDDTYDLIRKYKPGSIRIIRGGPHSHIRLVNKLQDISDIPLLVSIRAEWGLAQTLDSTLQFQKPFVMSAAADDSLIYKTGREIGRQMNELGIHLNFAPNGDFESNRQGYSQKLRSYGSNMIRSTRHAVYFMHGLQSKYILACAIHLPIEREPGQIIPADSSLYFEINPLDANGFYPYAKMVQAGLNGMLTSHLHALPKPEKENKREEVLQLHMNEMLKTKLKFNGLTFVDVPLLEKILDDERGGDLELLALEAGNDVLIDPVDASAAIRRITKAARRSDKTMDRLDEAVKKILSAKYNAGLLKTPVLSEVNLMERLDSPEAALLKYQVAEKAVTLLRNTAQAVPVKLIENKRFASLSLGADSQNEFTHYLSKYAGFNHYSLNKGQSTDSIGALLGEADVIIIGVFPQSLSLVKDFLPVFQKLSEKEIIVCHFSDPKELVYLQQVPTIIASYTTETWAPKIAAQVIFGAIAAQGKLPAAVSQAFPDGLGLVTEKLNRFGYAVPEAVGLDSHTLKRIEAITREAVAIGATPGSHVLVARKGKVVYELSTGSLTYETNAPVTEQTLYDLASVTKVSATLQAVMFMHEKGLIDINKKMSVYLPELKNSNKKDYTIKDILTHQAGLWPFLPFWAETVKDGQFMPNYYSKTASEDFPFPVADSLFAYKAMKDSLWNWIIKSKVREKPARTTFDYRYSDMGFYMLQHLAEKILNQPMEEFLEQNLYEPLGAYTMGYLPLRRFPSSQIAPTENDKLFRKSLLTGYVHDQGAAMHGGVAGHAGLFSTANDLAKLGQMLLQKGNYGGQQFYKPETIELFTHRQYEPSRRGLGWDKPTPSDWNGPTALFASNRTFGHTGFTGTCIWVDPEFDLVFVFLSNRVYPDMTNNKLLNANIRPRIQEVIYRAIFDYCQYGQAAQNQ